MTAPADEVDWAAVDRGTGRETALTAVGLGAFFVSLVALDDGYAGFDGTAGWTAVAALLGFFVVLVVVQRRVPRWRANAARGRRVQYALRHHVDPGAELRSTADVGARRLARLRWVVWCSPLLVAGWLAGGRWDRPAVAVPAAVVLTGLAVACTAALRRQVRWARRWVDDPPGPAREVPPPTAVDRWTGGRRLVLLGLAFAVLAVGAGLLAALVS